MATSVRSIAVQHRMHRIWARYGIRPTYLVDFPVASQADSVAALRPLLDDGACLIGAHLHPWVNPPYREEISRANSYANALPPALEREKLLVLTRAIERGFGITPRIYRGGRYGMDDGTLRLLAETGFEVDMSALAGADLRPDHGPDFRRIAPRPYWIGAPGGLLEIPGTRGSFGPLAPWAARLEAAIVSGWGHRLRLGGVLRGLGLLNRAMLTPEGCPLGEQLALLDALLDRGVRVFTLSYHSPSLVPGNTPYVRDEADLARFLDRVERFCEVFFGRYGGRATDPLSLRRRLRAGRALGDRASPKAAAPSGRARPGIPPNVD